MASGRKPEAIENAARVEFSILVRSSVNGEHLSNQDQQKRYYPQCCENPMTVRDNLQTFF
jgi:hypothetical protein